MWMARTSPHIPFERYADDIICHCKSAEEARELWSALADRFAACKLVLHPQKTKIVYCKDANRRGDFPSQSFDFLGFSFRARKTLWQGDIHTHGFLPAARPKALTSISRATRRWALHHHSDKSLQDLAKMYNPYIEGWINYYGHFYRTHLRPTLKRIDAYVIRWARRKFKRLRHKTKGARDWFERLRRVNPKSIRSLAAMSWQRPNIGSRMNREVHVRVWERAEVKFLRATRQKLLLPQCNSDDRFTSVSGHKGRRSWMMRALRILDSPYAPTLGILRRLSG